MRCLTASREPSQKRATGRFGDRQIFPSIKWKQFKEYSLFLKRQVSKKTISEFQLWMHFRWTAIQPSLRWTDARPSWLMWTGLWFFDLIFLRCHFTHCRFVVNLGFNWTEDLVQTSQHKFWNSIFIAQTLALNFAFPTFSTQTSWHKF